MNELTLIDNQTIQDKIYTIRGMQVMLDSDLAQLYEVETKALNQAVNRNIARFPEKFRFQLTKDEYENLRSQFVTLSLDKGWGTHRKYLPYVFTEQRLSLHDENFNKQYKNIELKETKDFHDRFLIIDKEDIYHLGASVKDLGNKVFAFSKLNIDINSFEMMEKLN